jgi:hypothetical protein
MSDRTDATYTHSRAAGIAKFLVVQAAILSLGAAWTVTNVRELTLERLLPTLRPVPLDVRPTYDYPVVVSDEQLTRVLTKLRPKNLGAKTKLNHIDHALRFWTPRAKFADPSYFSGEELRGIVTDHRKFAALYGTKQPSLLIDVPSGVRVRVQEGNSSSTHVDHTVGGLAEVGTPLDFPVFTPKRETTYRAMVEQALRDFSLNQVEYEWTALTLALFKPGREAWTTAEGQRIDFDVLARRLMREETPRGVCFGNHRLHTLAMFLRIDEREHILSAEARAEVIAFLTEMTARLVRHQHVDGYWDGKWPTKPASGDAKENVTGDAMGDRILATGHAMEWWSFAPAECHPPRETLAKAGQWLVRTIDGLTSEQTEGFYTYLSHAGRSLALWRGKLPYEVKLDEPAPAKADVPPTNAKDI